MAALWNVRVLKIDEKKINLELIVAHPDSGEFSAKPEFVLRILYDEAWELDENYQEKATGPLGEAARFKDINSADWMDIQKNTYIKHVELINIRNVPFDEQAVHNHIDKQVENMQISRSDKTAWDNAWNQLWIEFWNKTDNLPIAEYVIEVTDAKWLAHLDVGQTWNSAAFDD